MKIVFVFTNAPHAGIRAQEGLDALLMGSAFTECAVVFLDEAVYQLLPGQAPEPVGHKNFTLGLGALDDYGVSEILCSQQALKRAGLVANDLSVPVTTASAEAIRSLLSGCDRVLTF